MNGSNEDASCWVSQPLCVWPTHPSTPPHGEETFHPKVIQNEQKHLNEGEALAPQEMTEDKVHGWQNGGGGGGRLWLHIYHPDRREQPECLTHPPACCPGLSAERGRPRDAAFLPGSSPSCLRPPWPQVSLSLVQLGGQECSVLAGTLAGDFVKVRLAWCRVA